MFSILKDWVRQTRAKVPNKQTKISAYFFEFEFLFY